MASGYLLDADIMRLYGTAHPVTLQRVQANLAQVWLSSVTIEEMIVGRLNVINYARSRKGSIPLPAAHEDFAELLLGIRPFPVLVYSDQAERVFQTFPPSTIRVGPQDCRLAAQALAHDLTIVTRNLRDFEAIGAPCIDWSA